MNKDVVNAAAAAFGPVQGEYDVSGFMQGLVAIGKGVAIRDANIKKRTETIENMVIETDFEPLKQIFLNKQADVIASGDLKKGIKELKQLQIDGKQTLPDIKEFLFKMQKEKFSNAANPLTMNYIDAYLTGQLEGNIIIKDDYGDETETSSWMIPNPNGDGLLVVGMNNEYVDPKILLKDLRGMVRIDDSKDANDITTNFLADTSLTWTENGEGTKKWKTKGNIYKQQMLDEFENDDNAFLSFAMDRKHIINDVRTSFSEQYLNKFLDGAEKEALTALIEDYALNQEPPIKVSEVTDKVKGLLVREIMLGDPNLENDRNDFLDMIVNSKEPMKPSDVVEYNFATTSYSGYTPGKDNPNFDLKKATKTEKRDYEVVKDVEDMISGINNGEKLLAVATKYGAGLKLELVQNDDGTYYFRKNQYKKYDENLTGEIRYTTDFDISSKKQVRNMMPQILTAMGVNVGTTVYEDFINQFPYEK